jgi:hypothetical protein
MKKVSKKIKGIVKGAPSGLVISLLVHAAAFMLAGLLVVFSVVKKKEISFVPPPAVERPKMKLKKPKVKVKKSAKPASPTRIMAKVNKAVMPDLQLPELGGAGSGFGGIGDLGGFDTMPDLDKVTMFGSAKSIGNDLEGTLYDLKRYRNGRTTGNYETEGIKNIVEKFIRSGWKSSELTKYYRAPNKLYTPMLMVPPTDSALGTWAFGEREMGPWAYLLHYKGQLVHKDGIKFRFVAMADNYLVIRVNGKVVLDYKNQYAAAISGPAFKPLNYHLGHWYAYGSEWIELEPGIPQDVEFILGDYRGVIFAAMVAIEEYGVDYPRAPLPLDNPQLPIFKTAKLSPDQIDAIYQEMWEDHLDVTGGPVFNDYDSGGPSTNSDETASVAPSEPEPVAPKSKKSVARLWTLANGKTVEAEYVNIMGGKVVLKTTRGKIVKVPPTDFSEEDRLHVKLLNPPKLKLLFKKDTRQFTVLSNPDMNSPVPAATEFAGGIVIEQDDRMNDYQRPLRLEFYVILDEFDGDNYILHDRQLADFTLTPENQRCFELYGRKDVMLRYEHYSGKVRGEKYKGYMILVFNERDEIIAQNLSHEWLLDIREELLTFPVGRHFNKEGKRVHPPRPIFSDRWWDAAP